MGMKTGADGPKQGHLLRMSRFFDLRNIAVTLCCGPMSEALLAGTAVPGFDEQSPWY
jgi:hypothetical protein